MMELLAQTNGGPIPLPDPNNIVAVLVWIIGGLFVLVSTLVVFLHNDVKKRLDEGLAEQKRTTMANVKLSRALAYLTLKIHDPKANVEGPTNDLLRDIDSEREPHE